MASSLPPNTSLKELLEPAIEGPPSPESIRAFSNRVRRAASSADTTQPPRSHHTTSSASSSLRSHHSTDRTSGDTATLDGSATLSRKSSSRSTTSTAPYDRHESVLFGWARFGKKVRLRRETSPLGSSNSSVYSAEAVYDSPASSTILSPPATSHGPQGPSATTYNAKGARVSFFGRRRTARSGLPSGDGDNRRRLPISEPYGFQHLTHIQDEHVPNVPNPKQTTTKPKDPLHFPNFSSETLPLSNDAPATTGLAPTARQYATRPHAASVSSVYPQRQPLLHTRSQDQLRIPPPRPPRSPIEASSLSPPIPPPRTSSNRNAPFGDFSSFSALAMERPRTSGGFFRQPQPMAASLRPARAGHSHSYSEDVTSRTSDVEGDTRRFSRLLPDLELPVTNAPTAGSAPKSAPAMPEGTNWPLSCQTTASTATFAIIPEVPEEDEQRSNHRNSVRRSRMSTASNASSLRKSHSLPLLQLMQAAAPAVSTSSPTAAPAQRPPSSASDTLGGPDLLVAQRTRRENVAKDQNGNGEDIAQNPIGESWEDDIDYCYEHEIEADCEYAWDRPSIDGSREDARVGLAGLNLNTTETTGRMTSRSLRSLTNFSIKNVNSSKLSSNRAVGSTSPTSLLSPNSLGMPALSPVSQTSTPTISDAVTPTGFAARRPLDLVIRTDTGLLHEIDNGNDDGDDMLRPMQQQKHLLHGRSGSRSSRASSYKESHGFNLSPSFFIPGTDKYNWYDKPQDFQSQLSMAHGLPVGFALGGETYDDSLANSTARKDIKNELPAYLASTAAVLGMDQTPMLIPSRTSASTTASHYSRDSALSDRHISVTSTSTDLTRLTMSTASIEDLMYKTEQEAPMPNIPLPA